MSGLSEGSKLAGYRVDRLIAAGGMGVVYLAYDDTLRRRVALKIVAPDLAEGARYRERFLVEARMAAALDHPAIVPVYAAGEEDGRLFIAMRFIEGGSLADRIVARSTLAPEEALHLLRPVADALDAAHAAGLVHRDVKPANVLIDDDRSFLSDFGLARATASDRSSPSGDLGLSGTVGYLAPEQIEGDTVGPPADEYALASVLYECLSGRAPFARETDLAVVYAQLSEPSPSLVALVPGLPRAVDAVIARGLARRPAERYPTCRALLDDFAVAAGVDAGVPAARRARRGRHAAVVLGLVAAGAAAIGVAAVRRDGHAPRVVTGDAISVIDPVRASVTDRVPAGAAPLAAAAGGGAIWVLNADDQTITRLDERTHAVVKTFGVGGTPSDLAFGAGGLWVMTGRTVDTIDFASIADAVVRVDPATNAPVGEPIQLAADSGRRVFHHTGSQIATGLGAVWVVTPDGAIAQIDPATNSVTRRDILDARTETAWAVAVSGDTVWALGAWTDPKDPYVTPQTYLFRVDPRRRGVERLAIDGTGASDLVVGAGAVWVADPWDGGIVFRIDPGPPRLVRTIVTSPGAAALAFGDGRLWVANPPAGTVQAIDPKTDRAGTEIHVSGTPQALTTSANAVWVTGIGTSVPAAARSVPPGRDDVRLASCRTVFRAAAAAPGFLIVGDYPLSNADSRNDSDAVSFVLREHAFKAGRYTVGYQACDDEGGGDPGDACSSDAAAYVSAPRVIGVLTGYLSRCAIAQVPTLGAVASGPLAVVSPQNSADLLTSGRFPNFARVVPNDSDHADADVRLLVTLHARHVFVVGERISSYTELMAGQVIERARGRLGVAGTADFDDNTVATTLAARIARSGADAVYLSALADPSTGRLVRALRVALGPRLPIVAPDGFRPVADVIRYAGTAAAGIYITSSNPTNGLLSTTGKRWLRRFAATRLGGQVPSSSVLSAEAAEVLLAAIARSDGSRASVTREVRKTTMPVSLLGPLRFTPHGDVIPCAITVFRIVGATAAKPDIQSDYQGAEVVRSVPCGRSTLR